MRGKQSDDSRRQEWSKVLRGDIRGILKIIGFKD